MSKDRLVNFSLHMLWCIFVPSFPMPFTVAFKLNMFTLFGLKSYLRWREYPVKSSLQGTFVWIKHISWLARLGLLNWDWSLLNQDWTSWYIENLIFILFESGPLFTVQSISNKNKIKILTEKPVLLANTLHCEKMCFKCSFMLTLKFIPSSQTWSPSSQQIVLFHLSSLASNMLSLPCNPQPFMIFKALNTPLCSRKTLVLMV